MILASLNFGLAITGYRVAVGLDLMLMKTKEVSSGNKLEETMLINLILNISSISVG